MTTPNHKFLLQLVTLAVTLPMLGYVTWLILDSTSAAWKTGIESRPFVYIETVNVLVFMIYGLSACFLSWRNWKTQEFRYAELIFGFSVGSLTVFWIGLLTHSIGLLSN